MKGTELVEGIVLEESCVLPSVKVLRMPSEYTIVTITRRNFPSLEKITIQQGTQCVKHKDMALYKDQKLVICLTSEKTFAIPPKTERILKGAFKDCPAETILATNPSLIIEPGAFMGSAWEKGHDYLSTTDTLLYLSRDYDEWRLPQELTHVLSTSFSEHNPQKLYLPSLSCLEKGPEDYKNEPVETDCLLHEVCLEENPFPLPMEAADYSFENLSFQGDMEGLRWIDEVLFTADGSTLLFYPRLLPQKQYKIPEGTKAIGNLAFMRAQFLEEVVLPSSITSIGGGAFSFMPRLSQVIFSEGLCAIPDAATETHDYFKNCPLLTRVAFPTSLRRIGDYAFCSSELTDITLPEGLEEIGKGCFQYCSCEKIYLPSTLRHLGEGSLFCANEIWATEGTAKGLYAALFPKGEFRLSCMVYLRNAFGEKEGFILFPTFKRKDDFDYGKVWDGGKIDYQALAEHLPSIKGSEDKNLLALGIAIQEEAGGNCHRYLQTVSKKLGMELIEQEDDFLFRCFLNEVTLTDATREALLAACNKRGYTEGAALLLEYQQREKTPLKTFQV